MRAASRLLVLATVLAPACGGTRVLEADAGPRGNGGSGGNVVAADAPRDVPYAYFYANPVDHGSVNAVPAGGGAPVMLASGGNDDIVGDALAFDDANVYFSNERWSADVGSPPAGSVLALPIYAGAPSTLADGLDSVTFISVDGQNVYLVNWKTTATGAGGAIAKVPKTGGALRYLVELDGATAWPGGLTVAGGFVYWSQADGTIRRVSVDGGAPDVLALGEVSPADLAVDASGVYWLSRGNGGVDCTPTDGAVRQLAPGTQVPNTVAGQQAGVRSLAVGGGAVFWSTAGAFCNVGGQGQGTIFAHAINDLAPRAIKRGLTGPSGLYLKGAMLYFTNVVDENAYILAPVAIAP